MNRSQLSATRPEADNNNLKLITRKQKMLVGTRPCFLRQNDYGFAHSNTSFFEINVDYFLNLS